MDEGNRTSREADSGSKDIAFPNTIIIGFPVLRPFDTRSSGSIAGACCTFWPSRSNITASMETFCPAMRFPSRRLPSPEISGRQALEVQSQLQMNVV